MTNQQITIGIAVIIALWVIYKICVIDSVDNEIERSRQKEADDEYCIYNQERPFDEPINHTEK